VSVLKLTTRGGRSSRRPGTLPPRRTGAGERLPDDDTDRRRPLPGAGNAAERARHDGRGGPCRRHAADGSPARPAERDRPARPTAYARDFGIPLTHSRNGHDGPTSPTPEPCCAVPRSPGRVVKRQQPPPTGSLTTRSMVRPSRRVGAWFHGSRQAPDSLARFGEPQRGGSPWPGFDERHQRAATTASLITVRGLIRASRTPHRWDERANRRP
jgi:hypothetical protein